MGCEPEVKPEVKYFIPEAKPEVKFYIPEVNFLYRIYKKSGKICPGGINSGVFF